MSEKANLVTSRRAWIAVAAAVVPILAKELLNIEITPEQMQNVTALALGLIGALTFKDHVK